MTDEERRLDKEDMNVLDDLYKAYEQGRADYEAECQKIFEDNPPMHFNHEQIMWLKEFVKIRCNQARADAIDEFAQAFKDYVYTEKLRGNEPYWIVAIKKVSEKLKEQNEIL